MANILRFESGSSDREDELKKFFYTLTVKQHEVFVHVSEGRSTKEISARIGVSESAINQRIEAVRARADNASRAELARAYRTYLLNSIPSDAGANSASEKFSPPSGGWDGCRQDLSSASLCEVGREEVEQGSIQADSVVREAFSQLDTGVARVAAMVVIAAGLLLVARICLSVMRTLSDLA